MVEVRYEEVGEGEEVKMILWSSPPIWMDGGAMNQGRVYKRRSRFGER